MLVPSCPLRWLLLFGAVMIVPACGGASPARAVRPSAPTAKQALGEETCSINDAAPLVVDWPAHRRAELEAAMRTGGPVLATFDCKQQVHVLPDCRADGGYRYEAFTLKEELVRMSDADSVRARLPTMGASLALALEGSLARGSSLDLGLAMAGRWTTSARMVYGKELRAACRSATHFVRSVPTGAFAMSIGTRAKVRAVAEVFDAGAHAESESSYLHDTRDGDLAACRTASTSTGPAIGCNAPLRIELQQIDPRSEARARCETDGKMEDCVKWSNTVFDQRELDDSEVPAVVAKLVALCRAGQLGACLHARGGALRFESARGRSLVDMTWLQERSCELGNEGDCVGVADRLETEGKPEEAFRMREHACLAKDVACWAVADLVEAGRGPSDGVERRQYLADLRARGCMSSSGECEKYAVLYRQGLRGRGDFHRMQELVKTCERSDFGCVFAAAAYAFGIGVPRDLARARQMYSRYCATPVVQNNLRGSTCEFPKGWL